MLKRILHEPLVHFLAIGLGLFAVFGYLSREGGSDPASRIVVDRERLLTFMGYRSKGVQGEGHEAYLDRLSLEDLQSLIDEYVREEALYREALALGLDKNDFVLRRRLIRQLEFINQGLVSAGLALSETDLQAYLESHTDRYRVPAKITFTHVFFNRERHGDDGALGLARRKLEELNESETAFHQALSH